MGLLKDEDLPQGIGVTRNRRISDQRLVRVNSPRPAGTAVSVYTQEKSSETKSSAPVSAAVDRSTRTEKSTNPRTKLSALEQAGKNTKPAKIPLKYRIRPYKATVRRAAWDVSAIISLLVNAVLVAVIILLAMQVRNLKSTVSGLLGGLYNNFVALDDSVISTTIEMKGISIPINFSLPVQQPSTNVTLTDNVTIPNAYVVIRTESISINSAASVTLPRGTVLPVSLDMVIPVQTNVLLDLSVPVNIKLSESNPAGDAQVGLHDAFLGLQNTVGPYYCLLNPDIVSGNAFICQEGTYQPKTVNP